VQSDPVEGQWSAPPSPGGFAAPAPDAYGSGYASAPGGPFPGLGLDPAAIQSVPQPSRRRRGPLLGFIVGVVVVALGVGGYLIANSLSSRNNKPVATSSLGKSGGITVSGRGIQMTFPAGWVNVPTSPNQFQQFIKDIESRYPHISSALKNYINDPQILSTFAMLVYNDNSQGDVTENLDALVGPGTLPPSQMMAQLKSSTAISSLGATNVHMTVTTFGQYSGVLVTYTIQAAGVTAEGAQAYLDGPQNLVVTTVTSANSATSVRDLRKIVDTIKFT
jgi:hypothetical protein